MSNNWVLTRKINILAFTSWLQCKGRKSSQITACRTFNLDQIQCKKCIIFSVLAHFACWAPVGNDRKQCRQWPILPHSDFCSLISNGHCMLDLFSQSRREICFVNCMTIVIFKMLFLQCSLKSKKKNKKKLVFISIYTCYWFTCSKAAYCECLSFKMWLQNRAS